MIVRTSISPAARAAADSGAMALTVLWVGVGVGVCVGFAVERVGVGVGLISLTESECVAETVFVASAALVVGAAVQPTVRQPDTATTSSASKREEATDPSCLTHRLLDELPAPGERLIDMSGSDPKADLQRYLQTAREALLWKLEGLSDYDARRPMTPTGTNLLGLVKHVASVEFGYFGETFDRPSGEPFPWFDDDAEPNADMWATVDQSRDDIVALYHRAWAHSDATIESLPLDAIGHVPWWPADRREVTLHRVLVHMTTETHRHAGHADIVRELIDGSAGFRAGNDNMAEGDAAWWAAYLARLDSAANHFRSV